MVDHGQVLLHQVLSEPIPVMFRSPVQRINFPDVNLYAGSASLVGLKAFDVVLVNIFVPLRISGVWFPGSFDLTLWPARGATWGPSMSRS